MIPKELVASLLVWIAHATGYAIPGVPPDIQLVPHAQLEDSFCHRPCAVLGFTTSQGIILLDNKLAIGADRAATSILVHELTHFLQQANATLGTVVDCALWVSREDEAYEMQYRWLHETAPSIRVLSQAMAELGTHPFLLTCTPSDLRQGAVQP